MNYKDNNNLPFNISLSFHKLVEFWKTHYADAGENLGSIHSKRLISEIEKVPELTKPISDLSVIEKNRSLIDAMMSAVIPASNWDTTMTTAVIPFTLKVFYTTPRFNKFFVKDGEVNITRLNITPEIFNIGKTIGAYTAILNKFYNIDLGFILPLIITITDDVTGLDRYFKMNMDGRFTDIILKGELPEISEEKIKLLSENMMNLDIWSEIFPPGLFEFSGFSTINMIEVTEQEAVSKIKLDLLDKNVLANQEGFEILQQNMRILFRNPNIILGLAAINKDKNQSLQKAKKIINSFLLDEHCVEKCGTYEGSIYETVINSTEPIIVYDLNDYSHCTEIENSIKSKGIRNILAVSLISNQNVIGILELGSPIPGEINSVNALKLNDVLPLLTIALKNAVEEMENRIQAVIKEKCTAIHPSVEWRFRDAARNLIELQMTDPLAEMEDIVFKDVYPLYGLSDIRDSSRIRNESIQQDLFDNMEIAKGILFKANESKQMPIIEHLIYRINKRNAALRKGLHTGDEASIVSFIQNEVEPVFRHLKNYSSAIKKQIEDYYKKMNPRLGIYYNKRKEYEHSVSIINDTISTFVKDEEERAQAMFPHYFERYKTDGVEYSIYVGESISHSKKFDAIYLKNMRLWQMILMCGVVTRATALKEKLPMKLETANLVLVQDRPLTIRFHLDQKKFDVDGTYNVHYEIMKKRIDKAEIRGSEERLTQPGKIAIVYSQNSEANEYRQYIDYLQYKNLLNKEIEEFELEDMQGVYGLKALRVTVSEDKGLDKTRKELNDMMKSVVRL